MPVSVALTAHSSRPWDRGPVNRPYAITVSSPVCYRITQEGLTESKANWVLAASAKVWTEAREPVNQRPGTPATPPSQHQDESKAILNKTCTDVVVGSTFEKPCKVEGSVVVWRRLETSAWRLKKVGARANLALPCMSGVAGSLCRVNRHSCP